LYQSFLHAPIPPPALLSSPSRRSSDLPLDGRRAAIFRQQRRMRVEVAERWQLDHPLRNDAPVGDDDDGAGRELLQLRAKFCIVLDRKSTRLNSSHVKISYAVFCLKKKK